MEVDGMLTGSGNSRGGTQTLWPEPELEPGRTPRGRTPRGRTPRGRTPAGRGNTRRRGRPSARLMMPLGVPMALGLALGVTIAVSTGHSVNKISQTGLGSGETPTAAPPANADCELIVPADPLGARGLATPYQLTGPGGQDPAASGCQQSNPNLEAFVQATILDPVTGRLWVYEPLVVTQGSAPAAAPVVPKLPRHAVVDIMVGFNGNDLHLVGTARGTLSRARCVNGIADSLFGQVAYCNSAAFYAAANLDIAFGRLRVPASGVSARTGQPCPTTRSFQLVDQDPSDNVTSRYLLTADGQTAQDTAANQAALPGATPINNGSDNALLDNFVLPALGCTPFTAPDLSNDGAPGTSQTLDELSAAVNQRAPVALVPENDPMVMVNGQVSAQKTDLYRIGVGQPMLGSYQSFWRASGHGQQADTPAGFCATMLNLQTPFIAANQALLAASPSPVPATGDNLFTFLAARLSASFTNLNCAQFGLRNTVNLSQDGNGVAIAATFNLAERRYPRAAAPA
jgi:hypothetical protein